MTDHPGGRPPHPTRYTHALNARRLYGPEVDRACGAEEPAVDEWEAGRLDPTPEQVELMAQLTAYPSSGSTVARSPAAASRAPGVRPARRGYCGIPTRRLVARTSLSADVVAARGRAREAARP